MKASNAIIQKEMGKDNTPFYWLVAVQQEGDGHMILTGGKSDKTKRRSEYLQGLEVDLPYAQESSMYTLTPKGDVIGASMIFALRREDLLNLKEMIDTMVEANEFTVANGGETR